jgi:hypothetical protein
VTRVGLLRIIGYVLAGALVIYLFGRWEQAQGSEDGAIIQAAHNALTAGKAYRARQAKLASIAQQAGNRAALAIQGIHAKDTTIARLNAQLARDTTPQDSTPALVAKLSIVEGQRDSAMSALADLRIKGLADSTRISNAESRVAVLESNLHATLTVAECHLLDVSFLPKCPSRTLSYVLGGVSATVVVVALTHH